VRPVKAGIDDQSCSELEFKKVFISSKLLLIFLKDFSLAPVPGKGISKGFGLPAVLLAGLILVLCIPIFCKWGMPCNVISIWKIELGSDE